MGAGEVGLRYLHLIALVVWIRQPPPDNVGSADPEEDAG